MIMATENRKLTMAPYLTLRHSSLLSAISPSCLSVRPSSPNSRSITGALSTEKDAWIIPAMLHR